MDTNQSGNNLNNRRNLSSSMTVNKPSVTTQVKEPVAQETKPVKKTRTTLTSAAKAEDVNNKKKKKQKKKNNKKDTSSLGRVFTIILVIILILSAGSFAGYAVISLLKDGSKKTSVKVQILTDNKITYEISERVYKNEGETKWQAIAV